MRQLRQAAARERRAPIYWWLAVMMATGGALVVMAHGHSRPVAMLLAALLAAAWAAPLIALQSMTAPRRAKAPAPGPGEGTYDEWMSQARLLGRVLLYYEDNPHLPADLLRALHAAREDLRDTFRAHPLRDDLERACHRARDGAIRDVKNWFGREYRADIRELANEYEQAALLQMDEDARLLVLQAAVEKAAAMMSQNCMPRMLERERLACAADCSWLAAQAAGVHAGRISPVDLAEMLVIEWSDFSEPWRPARALGRARERLERKEPVPTPAPAQGISEPEDGAGAIVLKNGKKYRRIRVRVRTGRRNRHRSFHHRRRLLRNVFLSFGQWVRYSVRSWMLFR